jgi:hypothetical protein
LWPPPISMQKSGKSGPSWYVCVCVCLCACMTLV